jgi:hypothetical protein
MRRSEIQLMLLLEKNWTFVDSLLPITSAISLLFALTTDLPPLGLG